MATFRICEDQENVRAGAPRGIKEAQIPLQQQKRSVLGILSSNVSRPPAQKPLKQQDANCGAKKTVEAEVHRKFNVYTDEDCLKEVRKEKETVPDPVLDLPAALHRLPLKDLPSKDELTCLDSPVCSPMAVDKTCERSKVVDKVKEREHVQFMGFLDYRDDIYEYLLLAERRNRTKSNYMRCQPDVTSSMRSILVDWLVEVAEEYKLQTETLYLAVSFIDRFLSLMSVLRAKMQLVGTASMFIAAKYEEIFPPDVSEFAYITDDTYTKKVILRMEQMILKVLNFDVSIPTVLTFLNFYTECSLRMKGEKDDQDMTQHERDTVLYLAMYLSELSLVEGDPYLQFRASCRAAAAIALARHTLGWTPSWNERLVEISGYRLIDLRPCMKCLQDTFEGAQSHPQQAVREKFRNARWHNVGSLSPRSEPIV